MAGEESSLKIARVCLCIDRSFITGNGPRVRSNLLERHPIKESAIELQMLALTVLGELFSRVC